MHALKSALLGFVFVIILVGYAPAQFLWNENGVPLRDDCQVSGGQWAAQTGSGDLYVVWQDSRHEYSRIWAQKYSPQGVRLWANDVEIMRLGVDIIVLCPTLDGGLALAWGTGVFGGAAITAQKISADGEILWGPNGVFVGFYVLDPGDLAGGSAADERGGYSTYNVVADSSGGIFVAWTDETNANQFDLFVKHLLADGSLSPGWEPRGNNIKQNVGFLLNDYGQVTCSDDAGGITLACQVYLGSMQFANFVQRVDGDGNLLWGNNGLEICRTGGMDNSPRAARDGSGGAFFVWRDARIPSDPDLFMQRVSADGVPLWQENGLPLIELPGSQAEEKIVEDGLDGALIVWEDGGYYSDIYAQRVNGTGSKLWAPNGAPLATGSAHQDNVKISADGLGGLFAVWQSWRENSYEHQQASIQSLSPAGIPLWSLNGIPLSEGPLHASYSQSVIAASDGAFFTWTEQRSVTTGIYLQKADFSGQFQFQPNPRIVFEALSGDAEDVSLVAMSPDRYLSVWTDSRSEMVDGSLICYQILDADGQALLPENGVPIYTLGDDDQIAPNAAATSDGGAVIAWMDYGQSSFWPRVIAQKIDAQGNSLWAPEGVPVTDIVQPNQGGADVCSDGSGGAYVTFQTNSYTLYVQHFDALGNRLFGGSALPVGTISGNTGGLKAFMADGEGGAIAVYRSNYLLYAVRVLPSATVAWTDTVQITPITGGDARAIPALGGGGIVAWQTTAPSDIYAQKFDNAGNMLWGSNGTPVATSTSVDLGQNMTENPDAFIYFAWSKGYGDLYCQKLSPEGVRQFGPEGIIVCNAPGGQGGVSLAADGQGGALIAWGDGRNYGSGPYNGNDLYGTHLDAQGQIANPFWVPNGNPLCSSLGDQSTAQMVTDAAGGAVLFWYDSRGIYAQRVNDYINSDGPSAASLSATTSPLVQNRPNPFNPTTAISFELRAANFVKLSVYDIAGRLVATLADGWREAGTHEVAFDGSGLASGIYLIHLQAGDLESTGKMVLLK